VHDSIETAAPDLQGRLYRSPLLYGLQQSRWTLEALQGQVEWLHSTPTGKPMSLPGICKLLKRLGVTYKRGQAHLHSPDLLYDKKMAYIHSLHALNSTDPERYVLLYEDEVTYYRRAVVHRGWASRGKFGAIKVKQGARYNSIRRIAGCLDVHTGQLISRQRSTYPVTEMARFFRFVDQHYPQAQRIFVVLDNWFVHFHPYVLDYLAKHCPRIELVPLPTYAPWTNPMEKVWLKLSRDLLYHHPYDDDWEGLKQAVEDWLAQYLTGSQKLLHSASLSP
jgi:transposase